MNYVDIVLCIPLVCGLYQGFMKGLIVEAATLASFGVGVWGGLYLSDMCASKIKESLNWNSPYLPIISFAILFLGIVIIIYFIAKMIQKMMEGMALGGINKIGGALFGSLKYALVMSIVIFVMNAVEKSYPLLSIQSKKGSLLYGPIGTIAPIVIPGLNTSFALEKMQPEE